MSSNDFVFEMSLPQSAGNDFVFSVHSEARPYMALKKEPAKMCRCAVDMVAFLSHANDSNVTSLLHAQTFLHCSIKNSCHHVLAEIHPANALLFL